MMAEATAVATGVSVSVVVAAAVGVLAAAFPTDIANGEATQCDVSQEEEDQQCTPPEGTMCYEHKPPTLNSKPHAGYYETWRVFQMQKRRDMGQCNWKYLGGKIGVGVRVTKPTGMKSCSNYPNFTGRSPKGGNR